MIYIWIIEFGSRIPTKILGAPTHPMLDELERKVEIHQKHIFEVL